MFTNLTSEEKMISMLNRFSQILKTSPTHGTLKRALCERKSDLLLPQFLIFIACFAPTTIHTAITSVFFPKPQGFYEMHYLRPQNDFVERCEQPTSVSGIVAYHQSSKSSNIARALFGTDTLQLVGSALTSIPSTIVADNVGLAPDFWGTLHLCPHIKSVTVDFFYHLTLSNWCESLFIELSAPLVFTRWTLNAAETIVQPGSLLFPSCSMSSDPANPGSTAQSIKEALSGSFLFGDMQTPWSAGRFFFEPQDRTRLADITIALGYDFYTSDLFRVSSSLLSIMPTGNHFQAHTVFAPVVGNGSRWTIGASLLANGHYDWNDNRTFDAFIIGTFTYIFKSEQRRTFDFVGQGPLSRYLLLAEFDTVVSNSVTTLMYNGQLMNGVNFSTRMANVSSAVEGDLVAKLSYKGKHSIVEAGYTLYGRTNEHISLSCFKVPCGTVGHSYTFKGTDPVCTLTQPANILTFHDLDLTSGATPSAKVQTTFVQGGYQWTGQCAESAALIGISGTIGSYGHRHALNEWSIWTQYQIRF